MRKPSTSLQWALASLIPLAFVTGIWLLPLVLASMPVSAGVQRFFLQLHSWMNPGDNPVILLISLGVIGFFTYFYQRTLFKSEKIG